jgi:aminoglycoside phosphotransferase (APT) family kinase protein
VALPAQALAWVAEATGTGRVVRTRRLVGGITSAVDACWTPTGQVVLRRYVEPADDDAPERVAREAAALRGLASSDVPAPQLVAADPDGRHCGVPAVLMTRLPGAPLLRPADPDDWLRRLAQLLPLVHAAPVQARDWERWVEPAELEPPPWSAHPELWAAAIALVQRGEPPYPGVFIHRDFQHFNVLWQRQRVSGVVDWVEAASGPPDVDVGHCRLNLAVLYSADRAEQFRRLYEVAAGRTVEPYWDLLSLLGYLPGWDGFVQVQAGSRATVDVPGMHGRVDDLLARTVRRL